MSFVQKERDFTINTPKTSVLKEGAPKQLLGYNPMHLLLVATFYSPIILLFYVISLSFTFQNVKGFICAAFLIAVCLLRAGLLYISGSIDPQSNDPVCKSVTFSEYGTTGLSAFVFSFLICYISLPMFLTGNVRYVTFGGLLTYFVIDIGIRSWKGCITPINILLNIITGAALGIIIPGLLYAGGSSKYLLYNEEPSNAEVCSMPKKQKFKCAVYKNGEIVAST
jgi:hypothetical protein